MVQYSGKAFCVNDKTQFIGMKPLVIHQCFDLREEVITVNDGDLRMLFGSAQKNFFYFAMRKVIITPRQIVCAPDGGQNKSGNVRPDLRKAVNEGCGALCGKLPIRSTQSLVP